MRWRTGLLLPLLMILLVSALPDQLAGQEPAQPREPVRLDAKTIDQMVATTLREVLLRGVPLYNSGDFEGSHRLYEGALMALKPLLLHRPTLQKEIDGALIEAERTEDVDKRAWVLREAMDRIRTAVKEKAVAAPAKFGSVSGLVSVDRDLLPAGKINLFGPDEKTYFAPVKLGKYHLDKVAPGEYRVVLAEDPKSTLKIEPKYLDVRTTPLLVKVTDESPVIYNFGVKGVVAKALGVVRGKVTLDGKPLAGSKIVVVGAGLGTGIAQADKTGAFTIKDLKPGTYKVFIPEEPGGPKVDPKYQAVDTTPLRVVVPADKPATLDLKLESKPEKKMPDPDRIEK